jgi:alpha-tubulin suppressor-like RCC1 family protein/subtilisin family serine protease
MPCRNWLFSAILLGSLLGPVFSTTAFAVATHAPEPSSGPVMTVKDGAVTFQHGNQAEVKRPYHLPGRLVVKLKAGMGPDHLNALKAKHGLGISDKGLTNRTHPRFKNLYDVTARKDADLAALAAEFTANEAVEYAEPVSLAYTQLVPNDTLYPQQWSHQKTGAEAAWDITTGTSSTIIAVVDTGVDYNHPDLAANIWRDAQGNPGRDFVNTDTSGLVAAGYQLIAGEDYLAADNDPSDYNGHGTHVAGIIAASGNNSVGVIGVCPGCKVMPLRAGYSIRYGSTDYGVLQNDSIADAIIYAADNGARIISMSFGGPASQLEKDALDYADSKGVLLIAAAGNDAVSSTDNAYPAAYGNVLAVAATDFNDAKAFYSNYGAWVGVAAPGGDNIHEIYSTVPTIGSLSNPSGYRGLYGTSMAAPYVAGEAGLILSKNPNLSSFQVMEGIRQGVDLFNVDIPDSKYYVGTGRVNLSKALLNNSFPTCSAVISSPSADFVTGGSVTVNGSSSAPYRVLYGQGIYPSSWTQFGSGQAGSGVLATLASSALASPFADYTIKVVAEDLSGKSEQVVQGRIGKQFLPGWPQSYSVPGKNAPLWNAPTLADVDNDGEEEIIICGTDSLNRAYLSVFKKDGTMAPGNWPQTIPTAGTSIQFGVVAGDLNGDGNVEIVASVFDPLGNGKAVSCWDHLGNLLWSKVLEPNNSTLNISLADLYDDGKLEVITQTYNSKLYVLDAGGNVLWSYYLNEYDSLHNEKNVAVADLDGNGRKEIAKNVITNVKFDQGDTYRTLGGSLVVFNNDGTVRWKHDWPEPGDSITTKYYGIFPTGSPLVGDINGDGKPDIVVQVQDWRGGDTGTTKTTARFYAFDDKGAVLPGWPVTVNGSPTFEEMALGDLNNDGYPELVAATGDSTGSWIHAFTHTGGELFPPVPVLVYNNPVIADVTGDGTPDILVSDGNLFHVIRQDGSQSTLPIRLHDGSSNVHNTPVVTDLDHNGSEDLVFFEWTARPILFAWDLQVPHAPDAELFTRAGFDAQHSNNFSSPAIVAPVIATPVALPNGATGAPYSLTLTATKGITPYSWSVIGGVLPAGLAFNGSTGVLSGTPTTVGSYSFTIRVTGANAVSVGRLFTVVINSPVSIVTTSLPSAAKGTAYSYNLAAANGLPPYVWSLSAGPLPSGLVLHADTGVIDGTPTSAGSYGFTVQASDSTGAASRKTFTLSVQSLATYSSLAAGLGHSTAVVAGIVWTWGDNSSGQLGDGTTTRRLIPVKPPGLSGYAGVATGTAANHTLALKNDNTVWGWGANGFGQLGDGTMVQRNSPGQIVGLSQVTAIASAGNNGMAIKSDQSVWSWGYNYQGQVGDGTTALRVSPVQIPGLSGIVAIAHGTRHGAGLKQDGTVWAWGDNYWGEIGDGTTTPRLSPVQVPGLSGVVAIAPGGYHMVALKGDGTVWTWGYNSYGELGDGTYIQRNSPVQVPSLTGVVAIAAGDYHSVALKADGTVWSWGYNGMGQLGDGTLFNHTAPVRVTGLSGVVSIALGSYHSLAAKGDGTLWAWGQNNYGQLGDGTTTSRSVPVQVSIDVTVPITTATPAGGSYAASQTVTLTSNESATIYFTLDGSTPTTASPVYSSPLIVSGNTTLRYFAKDSAGNSEAVNSQTYIIGGPSAPKAGFGVSATTGSAPFSVSFSDLSSGTPASWFWSFGDAATSTLQNPVHTFSNPGSFTVSLTVTNAGGSDSMTKSNYISVSNPGPTSLQSAYDSAADGEIIRVRAGDLTENTVFSRNIAVKIGGGYDFSYQQAVGVTTLHGKITASGGKVDLGNLVLK